MEYFLTHFIIMFGSPYLILLCDGRVNVPENHGELEEVRDERHLDRVRALPGRNSLDRLPLPVLHERDERVLVAGPAVLPEHAVLDAGETGGKNVKKLFDKFTISSSLTGRWSAAR